MEIEKVVDELADKAIEKRSDSTDALRYSQAALNLAHVLVTLDNIGK